MLTSILLIGCSAPVDTKIVDSIENELNKDGEITKYITDPITITQYTSAKLKGYSSIEFDVNATANSNFINLSDKEKYDVLSRIEKTIKKNTGNDYKFECGEKYFCAFGDIAFANDEDTYSFESINTGYDLVMIHNDEEVYPLEKVIYQFMESQYESITNFGENYAPEIHDPQVAELAAVKFGISREEAEQIYIDQATNDLK